MLDCYRQQQWLDEAAYTAVVEQAEAAPPQTLGALDNTPSATPVNSPKRMRMSTAEGRLGVAQ